MVGNEATTTAYPKQGKIVTNVRKPTDLKTSSMIVVQVRTCRLLLIVTGAKSGRLVLAEEDPKTGWTLRAIAKSDIVATNVIPTMEEFNDVWLIPDRNNNKISNHTNVFIERKISSRFLSDLVALSGLPRRSNYQL
ncbi:uncharacterized protein LOC134217366 [Armigeres subalbatus]|uniref:uncharacterized protein LOC134217366 n=1 Tax=Armigeres subalbatus TaxID=124917 RepID=UPI002ED45D44